MNYSVVIPAYNAESTLAACLASVLSQSFLPAEVLIIDDCSSDKTEEIANHFKEAFGLAGVKYKFFRQPYNQGPSAARNLGIRESMGDHIAFLDADDTWLKDKLAIVHRFASISGAGLICHSYADSSAQLSVLAQHYFPRYLSLFRMLLRNPAQTSCVVILKKPGWLFNDNMRYSEDYDLWLRISAHAPILLIEGPALTHLGRPQLSPGGLSACHWLMRLGEIRAYLRFCIRSSPPGLLLLPVLILFSLTKHVIRYCPILNIRPLG